MPTSIEKAEAFAAWLAHQADIQAQEAIEASWTAEPPKIPEGHVALYGYEGQVEATMLVQGRPEILRRPIPEPLSLVETPLSLTPPVAEYRRVGTDTYERI
jgi:hypothetical protein